MDSPKREEFMAKLTAKVATKEEVKRLSKWEKKNESHCSSKNLPCYEEYGGNRVGQGQENALQWAKVSIEQAYAKSEAREKCALCPRVGIPNRGAPRRNRRRGR